MSLSRLLRSSTALAVAATLFQVPAVRAQAEQADAALSAMPDSSSFVRQFASVPRLAPTLTQVQKLALLRQKVKHVFVLFQEKPQLRSVFRHVSPA